jgi:uncharacterized protein (DUF2126 family)
MVWVRGLRRRVYQPQPGLHAGIAPVDPLALALHDRAGRAVQVRLWNWRPGGGAYDGLPADAAEAAQRRAERVAIGSIGPGGELPPLIPGLPGGWTVDLRDAELFHGDPA